MMSGNFREYNWRDILRLVMQDAGLKTHVQDNWRHGVTVTEVYLVGDDYYQARYRLSVDGETNGLRDGNVRILKVFPKQINVTIFEAKA